MEESNYFIKRRNLKEYPIPPNVWVFIVLQDGFKKIATLSEDQTFLWCVGKTKAKLSEVKYWIEEL